MLCAPEDHLATARSFEQEIALANEAGNTSLAASGYLAKGTALFSAGLIDEALEDFQRALAAEDESEHDGLGPSPASLLTAAGELDPEFAAQIEKMPAQVQRLLVMNGEPDAECPLDLINQLNITTAVRMKAMSGLGSKRAILMKPDILSAGACAKLRLVMDSHRQTKIDSVDGAPDFQRNLTKGELKGIIGPDALERLWQLPLAFVAHGSTGTQEAALADGGASATPQVTDSRVALMAQQPSEDWEVGIFVRRYTAGTRPWTAFHCDIAALTVNVALNDGDQFSGGNLLALHESRIRSIERREGEACVHPSNLMHGVTKMVSGVRYSLIVFFKDQVALRTSRAEKWILKGDELCDAKDYGSAVDAFAEAIALQPDDVEPYTSQGFALWEMGEFVKAEIAFSGALECEPGDMDLWFFRGNCLGMLGLHTHNEAAVTSSFCFNKAIALANEAGNTSLAARAYLSKGGALLSAGLIDEAVEEFERALAAEGESEHDEQGPSFEGVDPDFATLINKVPVRVQRLLIERGDPRIFHM